VWHFIRGTLIVFSLVLGIGWILYQWLRKSTDTFGVLITKWIVTGVVLVAAGGLVPEILRGDFGVVFLLPMFAGYMIILGLIWAPNIGRMIARPLTNVFDGGSEPAERRPCYSSAIAKRNRGAHTEAIVEARKQLAEFPNDYEGLVLIASIQAEELNDLDGGCWTLESAIQQPHQTPGKIVNALYLIADWRMKYGLDPDSARAALERVIELVPDTPTAQRAAQRIAHLPQVAQLIEQREHTPIPVPHVERKPGLIGNDPIASLSSEREEEARQLIAQLERHPLDADARERLAVLYASHYQRVDLAASELEQLISIPGMPPKSVVHYLNLLADFSVQFAGDRATAEAALLRITEMYPGSAAAEQAQARFTCLEGELSANKKSQSIPLGSYEKNIGLKKR
jgi:tetratricopeptide (TPR) repeat protein